MRDALRWPSPSTIRETANRPGRPSLHDWVTTVDHKKIGILYVLMSLVFLVIGGAEALLMRWQLCRPPQRLPGPRHVQSVVHDARDHDGLLRGDADPHRHRQLPGPADDRREGHGLPPPERPGVLGDALRRAAWSIPASPPAARRRWAGSPMPRLTEKTFARGPATDLWAPRADRQRGRHPDGGRELHRHDPGDASAGDGRAEDAVLLLDDALDLGADPPGHSRL